MANAEPTLFIRRIRSDWPASINHFYLDSRNRLPFVIANKPLAVPKCIATEKEQIAETYGYQSIGHQSTL